MNNTPSARLKRRVAAAEIQSGKALKGARALGDMLKMRVSVLEEVVEELALEAQRRREATNGATVEVPFEVVPDAEAEAP